MSESNISYSDKFYAFLKTILEYNEYYSFTLFGDDKETQKNINEIIDNLSPEKKEIFNKHLNNLKNGK